MSSLPLPIRAIQPAEWRAIMASTSAIGKSDNETELTQRIVDAIASIPDHPLAWYLTIDLQGPAGVNTAAVAGPAEHTVDNLLMRWASHVDMPETRALLQALRDGHPHVVDTMEDEGVFGSTPATADGRTLKSFVAVPVEVDGKLDGIMIVFGANPRQFDLTSVNIIKEVCVHLGAGLSRIRAEAALRTAFEGTLSVLTGAVEVRDPFTAGHQQGVADLSENLARQVGITDAERLRIIWLAASVHDVGKIAVPTELLIKPARLTPAEIAVVQEHAIIGERLLKSVDFPWDIATPVGQHHERGDGTGYPRGLHFSDITFDSRIVGVADVVEAMTHTRPYRTATGIDVVLEHLTSNSGIAYDPDVVDATVALFEGGYKLPTRTSSVDAVFQHR